MPSTTVKFKVGDKVLFTNRCPLYVREEVMGRARTIVAVGYSKDDQCALYQLGSRGKGRMGRIFRSYELRHVKRKKR